MGSLQPVLEVNLLRQQESHRETTVYGLQLMMA